MKSISIPVVVSKKEKIIWSEDGIIELHDKFIVLKQDYIYEGAVDSDDPLMGTKDLKVNYETTVIKYHIVDIEWKWDREDELYEVKIVESSGAYTNFNCLNKKSAIEIYTEIRDWMVS